MRFRGRNLPAFARLGALVVASVIFVTLAWASSASARFLASASRQGKDLAQHRVDRDSDHDGLPNWMELAWTGTNPHKADTDGDGLKDGFEVHRSHTDPLRADTDGDGLSDWTEVKVTKTNPRRADSDGNGIRDGAAPPVFASTAASPTSPPAAAPGPGTPGPEGPESSPPPAHAIWSAPDATVDVALTLDGSDSSGVGPLECTWSFENPSGSIVWQTRRGCVIKFTFDETGPKYVRLIVEGADGMSDSNKQTIEVEGSQTERPPPDTTPPDTTITASPPASTSETQAGFSFASTESGSTFACKLDSGSWGPCTSPRTYSSLALGAHSFSVRATDAAGNTDASPASDSWTVQSPGEPEPEPEPAPEPEPEPEETEAPAGAVFYIRDGGSSSTCSSWADACDALPGSLQRGATYYIASGRYAGGTFSTPASGSEKIRIRGATVANHGSDTGWQSSYSVNPADGGSQAVWTSGVQFKTSNWVFDGAVGPNGSKTASAYGFEFEPTAYAVRVYNTSAAISNVTISHVAATAPSGDIEKFFLSTDNSTKSVNEVTLSHTLLNGWSNAVWATSASLEMNSWLIEHNVILNGYSSAANHGEDINNNYGYLDNLIVRYNLFEGRTTGTGCIVVLNASAGAYYIYGNVFKDMRGGDGCITGVHDTLSGAIYNNTFINVDNGYGNGDWIGHDVSATVDNNLVYNSVAAFGANFTGSRDYNAYFTTTDSPSESHGYTSKSNPFVSGGFQLTASAASAMPAGISLESPFNLDPTGAVRGADGKWDRGAYEQR